MGVVVYVLDIWNEINLGVVDNDDTDNDADLKNFNFVGYPLDLVLQVNDRWLHLHHHKLPQELQKKMDYHLVGKVAISRRKIWNINS